MEYDVLICDDERRREEELVADVKSTVDEDKYRIRDAWESGGASSNPVQDATHELLARRSAARTNELYPRQDCLFDNVDVLILDYDLVLVDKRQTRHTGEGIARLVRMYSNCHVVVVLNQFRGVHFDLGLRGHLWSYADMNIHAEVLDRPGLWKEPPWTGFRPWSWHTLDAAVIAQRSRQSMVSSYYDEPIVDVLGLRPADASRLSDSAFSFLGPEAGTSGDLAKVTFRDFLAGAGDRDASAAAKSNDETSSRFVGARVGKWLEREVLGGQDVLVDIPHLVQRYPFLLGDGVRQIASWNDAIHNPDVVRNEVPTDAWFEPEGVLSRPAVWRQRFEADERIAEVSYEFNYTDVPALVFLEDSSEFAPLEDAKRFRAAYHNAFDTRFVKNIVGFKYGPQRRFALGD